MSESEEGNLIHPAFEKLMLEHPELFLTEEPRRKRSRRRRRGDAEKEKEEGGGEVK